VPAFAAWASPARPAPKPTLNQHSTRTTQWGLPIAELDEFLEVASAALPRITEIIVAFPAEHRAGGFRSGGTSLQASGAGFWLYRSGFRALGRCSHA
jgi:hypothetical protein